MYLLRDSCVPIPELPLHLVDDESSFFAKRGPKALAYGRFNIFCRNLHIRPKIKAWKHYVLHPSSQTSCIGSCQNKVFNVCKYVKRFHYYKTINTVSQNATFFLKGANIHRKWLYRFCWKTPFKKHSNYWKARRGHLKTPIFTEHWNIFIMWKYAVK